MRLFAGIALPSDVTGRLSLLVDRLRPYAQVRWSAAYNLHITTKFIGQWPEERLSEVIDALRPLGLRSPIDVAVAGVGWFPNPHSPRILFAAVKAGDGLAKLAADTEAALVGIGVAPENKSFRPHLTLARVKDPGTPLGPLRQAIARLDSIEFGSFTVSSFFLYLSEPGPAGSIYTQLAEIRLEQ